MARPERRDGSRHPRSIRSRTLAPSETRWSETPTIGSSTATCGSGRSRSARASVRSHPPARISCGSTRTPTISTSRVPKRFSCRCGSFCACQCSALERDRSTLGLNPHGALVGLEHLVRISLRSQPSPGEPDSPAAQLPNLTLVVRGQQNRRPGLLKLFEPREALLLEAHVADREDLVDQEHLRIDADRDRECETQLHAVAVGAQRVVEELVQL